MNTKYIGLIAILLSFIACNDSDAIDDGNTTTEPTVELKAGSADFSKYVAIGASFTAGFTDGALFTASQENSFPNILSKQFEKIGGGAFNQPLMSDNIGGLLLGANKITEPRFFFNGAGPARLEATPTTNAGVALTGDYSNFGIPGAKSFHIVAPGYGNVAGVAAGLANPYFARMASSPATTVLADALSKQPTFFTLVNMGGNDVLSYAIAGGDGEDRTGNLDPSTYGGTDITDPNVFAQIYSDMVNALTANGAKGVVATVPYVADLPYFTTVPYNAVPLDAATAATLNGAYAQYNGGLDLIKGGLQQAMALSPALEAEIAKRKITFAAGQNAVVLIDEDLTDFSLINPQFPVLPKIRQATAEDLLVLPSSSILGQPNAENVAALVGMGASLEDAGKASLNGLTFALADAWVLTPEEQLAITTATDKYNTTINAVATAKGLAVIDLKQILTESKTVGLPFDSYTLTNQFVFGGLISLDGIHLTARGYALMANKILEQIDKTYGSNFIEAGAVAKAVNYPTNYPEALR